MKKISILKLLFMAFGCSAIFVACNKDENPQPGKIQKMRFDWKITDITTPKKIAPNTDSSILKACMGDDVIKFNTSGFDFLDGANKCDSTIFYYSKGNWAYNLAVDSIQLSATTPAKYMSWKVILLNDSILRVKYSDSSNPANKISKTISFKH